jgi:hypothetical protein
MISDCPEDRYTKPFPLERRMIFKRDAEETSRRTLKKLRCSFKRDTSQIAPSRVKSVTDIHFCVCENRCYIRGDQRYRIFLDPKRRIPEQPVSTCIGPEPVHPFVTHRIRLSARGSSSRDELVLVLLIPLLRSPSSFLLLL